MRKALHNWMGIAGVVVGCGIGAAAAQADVLYTGSPNAAVTLQETSPGSGTYAFNEGYTWRDENGPNSATETTLGSWASRTWSYDADQSDSIGNTIMVGTGDGAHAQYVEYHLVIPVDQSSLGTVTVESVLRRGVTARVRANDAANWYAQSSLFTGGAGYASASNTVPLAALDTSTPGQVSFQLMLDQESGDFAGSIDSLSVTASTVPEPAGLMLVGVCAAGVLYRRRSAGRIAV